MVNDFKFWIYTKLISFHLRKVGEYNEKKKGLAKKMREVIAEKKEPRLGSAAGDFLGVPYGFWVAAIFYVVINIIIRNSFGGIFLGIELWVWFCALFSISLISIALLTYKYNSWQKRK